MCVLCPKDFTVTCDGVINQIQFLIFLIKEGRMGVQQMEVSVIWVEECSAFCFVLVKLKVPFSFIWKFHPTLSGSWVLAVHWAGIMLHLEQNYCALQLLYVSLVQNLQHFSWSEGDLGDANDNLNTWLNIRKHRSLQRTNKIFQNINAVFWRMLCRPEDMQILDLKVICVS